MSGHMVSPHASQTSFHQLLEVSLWQQEGAGRPSPSENCQPLQVVRTRSPVMQLLSTWTELVHVVEKQNDDVQFIQLFL